MVGSLERLVNLQSTLGEPGYPDEPPGVTLPATWEGVQMWLTNKSHRKEALRLSCQWAGGGI